MKKNKKVIKVKQFEPAESGSTRFFFTAPPALAEWVYQSSEAAGLYPYEFIRSKLLQVMLKD